jgi:hypothetical protein
VCVCVCVCVCVYVCMYVCVLWGGGRGGAEKQNMYAVSVHSIGLGKCRVDV